MIFKCSLIFGVLLGLCFPIYAAESFTTVPLMDINPDGDSTRNSEGDFIGLYDGRIALVYTRFTGGHLDEARAALAMRTSSDSGETWTSDTMMLEDEGGCNVMSVSLLRGKAPGELLLFYLRKDMPHTSCTMYLRRTKDDFKTLSDPVVVTPRDGYHVVNNARVRRLPNGRLVVPAALHAGSLLGVEAGPVFRQQAILVVYYSDDDGRTWKSAEPVPGKIGKGEPVYQEPGIIELTDGRLMMYIRSDQGCQMESFSTDQGETWSKPVEGPLKSPLSPATIERIPGTKTLVALWNDHSGRHLFVKENRTPFCVATSTDEGKTWTPSERLESDPRGWYCYTAVRFDAELGANTEPGKWALLGYCAGETREKGLNRLRVVRLDLQPGH